jgi:hypothetical protein
MRKKFEYFALIATIIVAAIWGVKLMLRNALATPASKKTPIFIDATDPESALAMGLRLPLKCVDTWALELIPKVPTKVAKRIFMQRDEIINKAAKTSERAALLDIYGVGDATAKQLLKYISLKGSCNREPQHFELEY